MRAARELAGGDSRRIIVQRDGSVLVANPAALELGRPPALGECQGTARANSLPQARGRLDVGRGDACRPGCRRPRAGSLVPLVWHGPGGAARRKEAAVVKSLIIKLPKKLSREAAARLGSERVAPGQAVPLHPEVASRATVGQLRRPGQRDPLRTVVPVPRASREGAGQAELLPLPGRLHDGIRCPTGSRPRSRSMGASLLLTTSDLAARGSVRLPQANSASPRAAGRPLGWSSKTSCRHRDVLPSWKLDPHPPELRSA